MHPRMPDQVTALPRPRPNPEMGLLGRLIVIPLVLLALPVLPFIAVYWVFHRVTSNRD